MFVPVPHKIGQARDRYDLSNPGAISEREMSIQFSAGNPIKGERRE